MAIIRGIDVSRWQKGIDWAQVAAPANDLRFAIVKIGGADAGLYTDPFGADNLKMAVRAGLEVGCYWFYGPQSIDAQAQRIEALLTFSGVRLNRGAWIDLEGEPTITDVRRVYTLVMALRLRGYKFGIYTRANIWNAAIASDPTLPTPESLDIPLWVAHYKPPDNEGPIMPKGWSKWAAWQFSSKGRVPGIDGDVDMNLWDPSAPSITPPTLEPTVYKVTATPYLNIRAGATTSSPIVGRWATGTKVSGYPSGGWVKMPVVLGGAAPQDATGAPNLAYYSSEQWMEKVSVTPPPIDPPIDPPPVVTTGKTRLGVNVVTGNGDAARRALAAGHTALSIINNFQLAADLANDPKITVMARRYVSSMPPPDPDVVFEGAQSPHAVYLTPLNECDVICYGSPEEIARRAAWDRDMWRKMKARGRKYAGGGFSVGTPDYTRPEICDAMRTHYAPLYADGMAINYHLYSPSPAHAMDVWYELRWRFLFERCGFDPNPNLAGIFCDETGLDQGGVGGFPAHGMSASDIGAWCRRFLDASQGNGYGNMLRAAVIFQAGNNTDWNGYNVDYAFPEIGAAAAAPVTRELARPRMIDTAVQPAIVSTPPKVMAQWETE